MAKQNQKEDTIVDVQKVLANSESFFDRNRKAVTIGLGAVAVLVAGFFAYQYFLVKPKQAEANNLAFVCDYWADKDSLEYAVMGKDGAEGYLSIAENYGSTPAGKRAHYYCGVYFRDNKADYATALEHFKQADFDDNAVGVFALGNVGDMYVMLGEYEQAASWLDKAAKRANNSDSRDFTGPLYSLKAAKAYLEIGNNDKAKTLLTYVLDNYQKGTQEFNEAEKLQAYISALQP
ncbi:MAG: tetratricopeptide repeat protein [Flavobacteriales bacterium]